jgi:hypothetical protein
MLLVIADDAFVAICEEPEGKVAFEGLVAGAARPGTSGKRGTAPAAGDVVCNRKASANPKLKVRKVRGKEIENLQQTALDESGFFNAVSPRF